MLRGMKSVALVLLLLTMAGPGLWAQRGHGNAHHVDDVRHDFSDAERWASVFEAEDRDEWQRPEHVMALMEIASGMTVADLGAGTGYFLEWLQQAVGEEGRVLALDPEPALIDYMEKRAAKQGWSSVEARQIPLDDPGLGADRPDRILIVDTWHHIESRDRYAARLRESLSEDGRILVVDFTPQSPFGPPVKHRIAAARVIEELEAGGLEASLLAEELPHQFVVVGKVPESSR